MCSNNRLNSCSLSIMDLEVEGKEIEIGGWRVEEESEVFNPSQPFK